MTMYNGCSSLKSLKGIEWPYFFPLSLESAFLEFVSTISLLISHLNLIP